MLRLVVIILSTLIPINSAIATTPAIYIFVSQSMPEKSLQQWAMQGSEHNASLLLRGFVNNSFKDTIEFTKRVFTSIQSGGFSIDPEKFVQYKIESVPAVVVDYGLGDDSFDVVYGDIGLDEALKIVGNK